MKKSLIAFLLGLVFAGVGYAITVNPVSNVTADSASTAGTIVLRDLSANFAAAAVTVTTLLNPSQANALSHWSRTKAQFDAITPAAKGDVYFCTDCAVPNLCVSTGTALAQFVRVDLSTAGCGTGN